MRKFLVLLILFPVLAVAQKKQITLEDIYKKGTFRGEFVPGFAGEVIDSFVNAADVKDENGKTLPLSDYILSADKKRVIILTSKSVTNRFRSIGRG